jgi:hypothetical protein
LKTQTEQQVTSIKNQKNNRTSQVALNRFKSDVDQFDPNWVRYGIAAVYPHQGYGLGNNYYLMSSADRAKTNLNDGVTFLRRSVNQDRLYVPVGSSERLCYPDGNLASDQRIYGVNITVDSIVNLAVGDWMIVWQAGNYILGVVSSVGELQPSMTAGSRSTTSSDDGTSNQKFMRLRALNSAEKQVTQLNSAGTSTGFVTRQGVVPASFDFEGTATSMTSDNSFCFDTSKLNFQKIASPVSYYVDYQTSNGAAKAANNTYSLDNKYGEKIKMLVRSEYVNGVEERQYLAPIDEVGFFYDLMEDGLVAKDVGREKTSDGLLNLNVANPSQATSNFLSSFKIVAVKLLLNSKIKNENTEDSTQSSNIKVAFDPSLQQDLYQDRIQMTSSVTQNLNTLLKPTIGVVNETIGKPAYIVTGSQHEVMLPVSSVEIMPDGSMGSQSDGKIYVYDSEGCSVNPATGCNPSQTNSAIAFNLGANAKFFPNALQQIELSDGSRKIYVGGVTLDNSGTRPQRKPYLGVIDLQEGESLESKLGDTIPGAACNISNCSLYELSGVELPDLLDTANISVDPENEDSVLVAPMTKRLGQDSTAYVYRLEWNGSSFATSKFAHIPKVQEGKLITAISDKPINVDGESYYAVCLSKNLSHGCGGECLPPLAPANVNAKVYEVGLGSGGGGPMDDRDPSDRDTSTNLSPDQIYGEIQLIRANSGIVPGNNPITLSKHNYMCSSLQVDSNQNLIIGGRLTIQPKSYNDIKLAIQTARVPELLYLDEAVGADNALTKYADYFQVDPETFSSGSEMWIGWMTGVATVEFPDGTFGLVNGNKYRLAPGYMGNTSGTVKEFSNAGIATLSLSGMTDRVIASIETDPININNSFITASYASRTTKLPSILYTREIFC